MDSIIAFIVTISLMMFAGLTIYETTLEAQETMIVAWQDIEERATVRANTKIMAVSSTVTNGGNVVEVVFRNEGSTKITDFDEWDVIFHYYPHPTGLEIDWFPNGGSTLNNNEWVVEGIYIDAAASQGEVYEPGILNPGEEILIYLRPAPKVANSSTNLLTVVTPNGISASATVIR